MQVLNSLTDRLSMAFLLVESQAKAEGVGPEDLEQRIYGDGVSNHVSKAFLEECTLFFQKLGQPGLASLATKAIETMEAGQTRLSELIDSGEFSSLLDQAQSDLEALLLPNDGSGSPS